MNIWTQGLTLADCEKKIIIEALRFYQGNKSRTADALGVTVKTIYNKMEAYGINGADDKREDAFSEGYSPIKHEAATDSEEAVLPTSRGQNMESGDEVSEEFPMSLRKQHEVQKMSPSKTSAGNRK